MFQRHSQLLGECMEKLFKAKVLIAGVGGLGCTVSSLLIRLGAGQVYLLDDAVVDEPDLNRQILYDRSDLGHKKVVVAQKKLSQMNPQSVIVPLDVRLDVDFCLPSVDVVIDCLDSFESKFALDILCEKKQVPLVHAGVEKFCGQLTTILPGSLRLRQIFPAPPKEDRARQIFPPLVVLVASLQASEAVRLLCGQEPLLNGKLMLIDLFSMRFEVVPLRSGAV